MTRVTVTVDCTDPGSLAAFWRDALGYGAIGAVAQYCSIGPAPGGVDGPKMIFQQVPEPKAGKNRLHLDLDLDAGVALEPEVERLQALGATTIGTPIGEFGLCWQVMADPEGNEFCVVAQSAG